MSNIKANIIHFIGWLIAASIFPLLFIIGGLYFADPKEHYTFRYLLLQGLMADGLLVGVVALLIIIGTLINYER